jgi:hypothetical protein
MAAKIKFLLSKGFCQHHIAARFGINQGRVSEIKTGKSYSSARPDPSPPEAQPKLPF